MATPGFDSRSDVVILDDAPDMAKALARALPGKVKVGAVGEGAAAVVLTVGLAGLSMLETHTRALMQMKALAGRKGLKSVVILQTPGQGLTGLAKTAAREWPGVTCRAIVVDGADADAIAGEILQGAEAAEVRLGAERLVPVDRQPVVQDTSAGAISTGDVFLVTGGARGVTADCVVELAARTGAAFVLLGRSEIVDWPGGVARTDDAKALRSALVARSKASGETPSLKQIDAQARALLASAEISVTLERIAAAGGRAEYIAADVSDTDRLDETIQRAQAAFGPITGLIHGAGVLADKLIAEKTEAQVARVFGPKVLGLEALLAHRMAKSLRHVALFSSVAARYGNAGQSDYAMANEVLNRTAEHLKVETPEKTVVSFNWGPWDGGMVDAGLKAHFAAQGVSLIPCMAGAQLFADVMLQGAGAPVQLVVGGADHG